MGAAPTTCLSSLPILRHALRGNEISDSVFLSCPERPTICRLPQSAAHPLGSFLAPFVTLHRSMASRRREKRSNISLSLCQSILCEARRRLRTAHKMDMFDFLLTTSLKSPKFRANAKSRDASAHHCRRILHGF